MERGRFAFWRTIICPPFTFEWRDRELGKDVTHSIEVRYRPHHNLIIVSSIYLILWGSTNLRHTTSH